MSTGASYRGEYSDDVKQGHGIYCYPDGAVYNGQFQNDYVWGNGLKVNKSLEIYSGGWVKGHRCGVGALRSPRGTMLASTFGKTAHSLGNAIGEGVTWSAGGLKANRAQDGKMLPEQPLTLVEAAAIAEQLGATAYLQGIQEQLKITV